MSPQFCHNCCRYVTTCEDNICSFCFRPVTLFSPPYDPTLGSGEPPVKRKCDYALVKFTYENNVSPSSSISSVSDEAALLKLLGDCKDDQHLKSIAIFRLAKTLTPTTTTVTTWVES